MPFLEIITRHFAQRPKSLIRNMSSLDAQTDDDWMQTLLIDDVGRGVEWANRQLGVYAPDAEGDYIWILDDDDECIRPTLVSELKAIVAEHEPDLIMLRGDCGNYGVLPPDTLWEQSPQYARICMSGFVVRREVFQWHADAWPNDLAGDYAFISAVYASTPEEKVFWHDVVAMKIQWKGGGRPESRKPKGKRRMG
jgi:hypothetical protein